jgi:DNA-binding NarL/FixJ family response regulator
MSKLVTVSIVDDNAELRDSIITYLAAAGGFRCVSRYANAEDALKKLPLDQPSVILMDIKMGAMDGIECVRRLKVLMPEAQVLMLTVFEDTELIFNALKAGASGYLLKRMPPAKLVEAIREVVDGGSPMSAPIARKIVQSFQSPTKPAEKEAELSAREKEVLDKLTEGLAYKQIADELGISIHTVANHIRHIYDKLHVQTRTEAVVRYLRR